MNQKLAWLIQRWLVLLGAVVAWELVTRAAGSVFFPPPTAIAEQGIGLWITRSDAGQTWTEDILPSISRVVGGFLIAAVLGVALGTALGRSRTGMDYVGPIFAFIRAIPPVMLIPVFLTLFGIDDEMKMAVIVFGSIWPVLLNTVDGVRSVDPLQADTARSFRTSRGQWLTMVVLPAALPKIFAGLRVALSIAVLLMVVSELVGRTSGIGYELIFGQRQFEYKIMWAWIVFLGILGYGLNTLFLMIERRALAWQPSRHTERAQQAGG